ncbi:cysteine hydrolase family protein [Herbaspirillum sp. alder98]|uniref:cysteine hydrolase family protein n=1 Tax=Herbaspirillum sp. alder98 TaxID=2913096 RepID=UPI001CD846EA|nr:isochorismatase family protein [Herbaspirillum sp. alder98]MCA1323793.1 cysteine hydrolase [Herbaspirillum sp. alder98]
MTRLPRCLFAAALALACASASAQGVYNDWNKAQPPAPPALVKATVDPATTAVLVLDIAKQTCNAENRPRCIAMLPGVAKLLGFARAKGVTVIYTLGAASKPADIWPEAAMQAGEPLVTAGPDKFVNTNLEQLLRDKGIKTVIAIGAAAHGAVLHTAASAAFRGFDVLVPVDLIASETPYAEQYTVWHLVNAPRLGERVKLTRSDWLN